MNDSVTKTEIEEALYELDILWEYGRNDSHYTHYDIDEFRALWVPNRDTTTVWIEWINPNNGNQNDIPFRVKNKEELKTLLSFYVDR